MGGELDYLASKNSVRLLGPREAEGRAPTVAVALDGDRDAEATAAALGPHGIMAGGGDFYAVRPLTALGVDLERGVLRMSFVHYTSEGEIGKLIKVIDSVL